MDVAFSFLVCFFLFSQGSTSVSSINPLEFKGLTPQEIIEKIRMLDPGANFEEVYNRDEWVVLNLSDWDFFSIDGTADHLVIKVRKQKEWMVEQALAWLQQIGVKIQGDFEKNAPKRWSAKASPEFLASIVVATNQEAEDLSGSLFGVEFTFQKTGNQHDKIVMRDGQVIECEIVESGQLSVKFRLPDEAVLIGRSKNQIKHILYRSGRLEKCSPLPTISGPQDWHKVILTTNPADVEGLKMVREFKATSKSALRSMNEGARIAMKKKAATIRAPIVLLQDKDGRSLIGLAYK